MEYCTNTFISYKFPITLKVPMSDCSKINIFFTFNIFNTFMILNRNQLLFRICFATCVHFWGRESFFDEVKTN